MLVPKILWGMSTRNDDGMNASCRSTKNTASPPDRLGNLEASSMYKLRPAILVSE